MMIVDTPGFQNPEQGGSARGASFEELCHNYAQDRLQRLFHEHTFVQELERYKEVAPDLASACHPSPSALPSGLGTSGRASVDEGGTTFLLAAPSQLLLSCHLGPPVPSGRGVFLSQATFLLAESLLSRKLKTHVGSLGGLPCSRHPPSPGMATVQFHLPACWARPALPVSPSPDVLRW